MDPLYRKWSRPSSSRSWAHTFNEIGKRALWEDVQGIHRIGDTSTNEEIAFGLRLNEPYKLDGLHKAFDSRSINDDDAAQVTEKIAKLRKVLETADDLLDTDGLSERQIEGACSISIGTIGVGTTMRHPAL